MRDNDCVGGFEGNYIEVVEEVGVAHESGRARCRLLLQAADHGESRGGGRAMGARGSYVQVRG